MRSIKSIALCFILFACGSFISGRANCKNLSKQNSTDGSAIIEQKSVQIPTIKGSLTYAPDSADYLIGINDSLYVNIYGDSNIGSPIASTAGVGVKGSRVDGKGNIQLPIVGSVNVEGLTLEQAKLKIADSFRKYVKNPSVVVEIAEYRGQPLYLTGEFRSPGVYYLDRPLNLIQAISLGQGLTQTADMRNARLIRDNQIVPVDIYELLKEGNMEQNIALKKGDTIYFPDNKLQKVFVFGEVEKPGEVPIPQGTLSLPQALASAGGLKDQGGYNIRQIRIIRSISGTKGELLTVDLKKIMNGQSAPFMLAEGDIVFVGRNRIGNWNHVVKEILPSLQAVGAVLSPFTSLLFFTQTIKLL